MTDAARVDRSTHGQTDKLPARIGGINSHVRMHCDPPLTQTDSVI